MVTRQDLSPGYQIVQSTHAVADFIHSFPDISSKWKQESNSIISLSVKNEESLIRLTHLLQIKNINFVGFNEPDINNQLTSICIEPSLLSQKVTSSLPLSLKDHNVGINKNQFKQNEIDK